MKNKNYVIKNGTLSFGSVSYEVFEQTLRQIKSSIYKRNKIKNICLPDFVTGISPIIEIINEFPKLENILVDDKNKYVTSIDGILYSKNKGMLLYYPKNRKEEEYVVCYGIKTIGPYAFYNNKYLKTVIIADSVTEINKRAFFDCESLEKVFLSQKLISIDDHVFSDCENITKIDIPDTVTTIGGGTFSGCINLVQVKLPEGISVINDYTFARCEMLTEIVLPNNLEYVGHNAFVLSNLKDVTFNKKLGSFAESAFYDNLEVIRCTQQQAKQLHNFAKKEI